MARKSSPYAVVFFLRKNKIEDRASSFCLHEPPPLLSLLLHVRANGRCLLFCYLLSPLLLLRPHATFIKVFKISAA